jgi:hypothetical protein
MLYGVFPAAVEQTTGRFNASDVRHRGMECVYSMMIKQAVDVYALSMKKVISRKPMNKRKYSVNS